MSKPRFQIGDKVMLLVDVDIYNSHEVDNDFLVVTVNKGETFMILGINTEWDVGYLIDQVSVLEGTFEVWVSEINLAKFDPKPSKY